jgi:cell division protein FtsL
LEARRLMDAAVVGRAAVTVALLVGSLGYVTWRQSRALETLAEWDELRRRTAVARAQVVELEREIQVLSSRSRVVPEARERLGMHTPDASELVILLAEPAK